MKHLFFRFLYLFRQAFLDLKSQPLLHCVGMATIGLSFLILVFFAVVYQNLQGVASRWVEKIAIFVFLHDEVTPERAAELQGEWRRWPEVGDLRYISKAEALDQFKRELGDKASLLENLPRNPLPSYFEVSLKAENPDPKGVQRVARRISRFKEVEEVQYGQGWAERFLNVLNWLRWGGVALGIALSFACLLIIANTIRLSLFARRDEIDIMQLVGATDPFIRIPYLLEGVSLGVGGVGLAMGLAYLIYKISILQFGLSWTLVLGISHFSFLSFQYAIGFFALGAFVGCFGSFFSLNRFLKSG